MAFLRLSMVLCGLVMVLYGLIMVLYVLLWQNIGLIGLESSFLAVIDPNSFVLVFLKTILSNIFKTLTLEYQFDMVMSITA